MVIALDVRRRLGFGIATYVRNIVRALARLDAGPGSINRYLLIGRDDYLRQYRDLPENFTLLPFSTPPSSVRSTMPFYRLLKQHGVNLLHIPHLFKTPRFAPCPYIVTVHDLLDFIYLPKKPTPMQQQLRLELARWNLRRARRIVSVSQATKNDIVRVLDIPDEHKITVIYNAIDERLVSGPASDADRALLAERYQVHYPFLLYAGSGKPHKNVGRLIEAFSALKAELKKDNALPDLKLLIIGEDLSTNPELRRTVVRGAMQSDVRFLGFVPIENLRIFYDLAKIFVFPSLYEGFGLPPLEAMAHGTPVVTSNTASLPEVVGNAAVLVNPENVFEIMHALHRVLLDQALRELLKRRGYEQAKGFSWDTSARTLLNVYASAAAPRKG